MAYGDPGGHTEVEIRPRKPLQARKPGSQLEMIGITPKQACRAYFATACCCSCPKTTHAPFRPSKPRAKIFD